MRCVTCGFDAPPDFAFCPKCGRALIEACPSCGAPGSGDFAFCPRCGTRLAHPPAPGSTPTESSAESRPEAAPARGFEARVAEGDRRPVTVLFADLSGFTGLSERLDPEDVRALQADLFGEMAAAIDQYGGFVEKYVGDAVLAVFGAPTAHEDDPERAVHAGLDMQRRLVGLNRRWERRVGEPMALRVGINTGPVVAGTLGAGGESAYAVSGDTVNVAARLQDAAPAGQILVSEATHRLTKHAFTFTPLGAVPLKGKAHPVPIFRVLGALDAPRSARGLESLGLTAPFIGREAEIAQLLAAFERMQAGRTQVVSLIGEAGVGKSRLLAELLSRLESAGRLSGTAVRRARCSSLGEQTYGVVAALLREAYGVTRDDSLETAREKLASGLAALGADAEERARFAALLGHVLGLQTDDPRVGHLEPEQLKRQVFLAARALVERRLEANAVLLVVEDLHWADAASIELLRVVVERLHDRQLMLVAAYRPTMEPGALAAGRVTHTAIRLEPLSPGESQALVDALLGPAAARSPMAERIVGRTGGNALYIEEIVRSFVASGALARQEQAWRWTTMAATAEVPPSLQGLLLARLDQLPAEARNVLEEAAVLGPTFSEPLLRRISTAPETVGDALERLQEAEFVAEASRSAGKPAEGRYSFTQALVQEVTYENLLQRRRTELHTRVGQTLEALCGPAPTRLEDLEALGHHWSLGTDKLRGARYLVAAGDWARAIYANADAARHYQRALETLDECDGRDGDRLAVWERMGDLLAPTEWREKALDHYERARRGHEAAGDRRALARLLRKVGGLSWEGGDRERALECFHLGLGLLEGRGDDIELAHLYQEMGRLAFRAGEYHRAIEWAERALAHAEPVIARPAPTQASDTPERREAAAAVAHAYNTLGAALARLDRLAEAVARVEQSVAVAEAEGLLQVSCRGYANLGVLYSTLDPGRSIETCRRGLEVAKRIGDLGFQSRLYANLAVAYCALTNQCDEQGIDAAEAAIELDRRLGLLDHLAIPLIVLGQIYQCHGEPDRARTHYEEARVLAEEAGDPQLLFPCYDGLATLALERGDDADAERWMQRAQSVCERAGVDPDALVVLPFLG